jgi:ATP-dependent DNA helicase RecQ
VWEIEPSTGKSSPSPSRSIALKRPASDSDPTASLTPNQQDLDRRLRDWRKSEAERLGLPQFFVFGSSTLRSVVLKHPRTLDQLRSIGIGADKLEKYGTSILEVCNA